ncbi:MAG: class I SAM-dependent methyltransferase, partial [Pricia sp.]
RGSILDIGCGAGSHTLLLQEKGYEVTALDSSKGAIETCRLRGLENCIEADIFDTQDPLAKSLQNQKFDTLLLLMNGIGIVGRLENLYPFLNYLKRLLNPGGQVLLDSSDIIYMYDEDDDGGRWVPDTGRYYGEVEFELRYKGQKSELFDWLYVDYRTLTRYASDCGLQHELVRNGEHYDYLVRLWH